MTDIERAARALWNVWRQSKAAEDWAADVTWEKLSEWVAIGNSAAEIVRDTAIAEITAVIESVLLEPSEEAVNEAIWAACPELKPWTEGEHVKVPVVCQRCPASVPIMGGKYQGLPACRAFAEHIVRPALRAAALAILGRDGSAG